MPEYLAPGVYVEETSFRAKSIEGVGTSTTAFVGPTRRGPVGETPELITSLTDFERIYGSLENLALTNVTAEANRLNFVAHAARAYFDNGGSRLYVVRTSNSAAAASAPVILPEPAEAERITALARMTGQAGNGRLTFRVTGRPRREHALSAGGAGRRAAAHGRAGTRPTHRSISRHAGRFRLPQGRDWRRYDLAASERHRSRSAGRRRDDVRCDSAASGQRRDAVALRRVHRPRRLRPGLGRVVVQPRRRALDRHRAGGAAEQPRRPVAQSDRAALRGGRVGGRAAERGQRAPRSPRRYRRPAPPEPRRGRRRRGAGGRRRDDGRQLRPRAAGAERAGRHLHRRRARQQRVCRGAGCAERAHLRTPSAAAPTASRCSTRRRTRSPARCARREAASIRATRRCTTRG